jgi:hypothetical protein
MPSSGYTANSFTANQQPTTAIWNELWANDASFNSGAGFNDSIIITRHIAAGIQLRQLEECLYKFSYQRTTALSLVGATPSEIVCNSQDFDTSGNYSTSTGLFTAPIAGFYFFTGAVSSQAVTGGHYLWASLWKNGSEILRGGRLGGNSSGTEEQSGFAKLLKLAANDTISLGYSSQDAQSAEVGSEWQTYIDGYLISAT